MTRQANAAHDVGIEVALPIFVGDRGELLGLEYPEVVDQNVGVGNTLDECGDTSRCREVGSNPVDFRLRHLFAKALLCSVNGLLVPSVDGDGGACRGKALRNREADARRGACYDCTLVRELDLHDSPHLSCHPRLVLS